MRKTLLAILCCGLLFAGVVEAGKGERSAQPHRYIAQSLDRDLVQAVAFSPGGDLLATYRGADGSLHGTGLFAVGDGYGCRGFLRDGETTYHNRFRAIPKAVPFRPEPLDDVAPCAIAQRRE